MHLDDEQVQRLLHGELEPSVEPSARRHLAGCEDCRVLVDEAREEERRVFGLLREVDHRLPEVDPHEMFVPVPAPQAGWGRWAAGFLLAAAVAGAAYATPGSPLPSMLGKLLAWVVHSGTPPGPAASQGIEKPSGGGIAVSPGEWMTIRFVGDLDRAVATVSLTDDHKVVVRAVEGSAAFTSDVDRLSVHTAGPARFEILIPRTAPSVEIVAGATLVFRVDSSAVVTRDSPDADGRYPLRLLDADP
jgi:hypothetical protein